MHDDTSIFNYVLQLRINVVNDKSSLFRGRQVQCRSKYYRLQFSFRSVVVTSQYKDCVNSGAFKYSIPKVKFSYKCLKQNYLSVTFVSYDSFTQQPSWLDKSRRLKSFGWLPWISTPSVFYLTSNQFTPMPFVKIRMPRSMLYHN